MKENKIAIIKKGLVDNIINASDNFAKSMSETTINITGKSVSIGFIHNLDNTFSNPDTLLSATDLLVKKTEEEKAWRDSELLRTDKFAMLPDYSSKGALLTYRNLLRNYPKTVDFPNGIRPIFSASLRETLLTKYQFLNRLTKLERKALTKASKINEDLEDWLMLFKEAEIIDIENLETIAGINALETGGLIAVGRALEILK